MLSVRWLVILGIAGALTSACGVPDYSFAKADASTSAGGAAGSGGTGGSTGEAGPDAGCQSDQDCADPTPHCNTSTGQCVRCLPSADTCPSGQYCASATDTCQLGCKSSIECNAFDGGTGNLQCDPKNHVCDHCATSADCPPGDICNKTTTQCVPGCDATHGCGGSQKCCSGKCVDTAFDVKNCGSCGHVCQFDPTNSTPLCSSGTCKLTCKQLGTFNCNGNLSDGCEANVLTDPKNCGTCGHVCTANQTCQNKACVSADAG